MNDFKISHKHLNIEDRETIEKLLKENYSFKYIGYKLKKHPTTISKEIRNNKIRKMPSTFNYGFNFCAKRKDCTIQNLCVKKCHVSCSSCKSCNSLCSLYEEELCSNLQKSPYVCNGCNKTSFCRKIKYYYRSKEAQNQYEANLKESRSGINLCTEELEKLDTLISPLIRKGQSITQIYASHKDTLPCSIRCLYNYIDSNILSVKNIDLRRKVKYKPRRKTKIIHKDTKIRLNRTYDDFNNFIAQNPDISIVEMDTVEGIKGSKLLLTLLFRKSNFMLAFIIPNKTPQSVINIFNKLTNILGIDTFKNIFACILTDNGSEFSKPNELEVDENGTSRCKIFYCDARRSDQKRQNRKKS